MATADTDVSRQRTERGPRVPPHNLQAEESLLGAMLLRPRRHRGGRPRRARADDFYKPAHGHIYDAITSLYGCRRAGRPGHGGRRAAPGRPARRHRRPRRRWSDLQVAHPGHVQRRPLRQDRRGARAAAPAHRASRGEIAEIGYDLPDDVTKAVDRAESLVFEVAQRRVTDTMAPIHDLLDANLDRLEQLYERGESITGVPTGFADLDELLSGLQPSAPDRRRRPPLAGQDRARAGHRQPRRDRGQPAGAVLLARDEPARAHASACCAPRRESTPSKVRNGNLTEADWTKIAHAAGRLAEAPICIDDNPNLTIMEIRAKARRLKSRTGDLGLVVVDYLQLMTGRSSGREPPGRGVRDQPRAQDPRPRARVPGDRAVAAVPPASRCARTSARCSPTFASRAASPPTRGCSRADTGAETTMAELLASGERNVPVWSLDDDMRLVQSTLTHVFSSGVKHVFELALASGRKVKASANHPFRTLDGWTRLDALAPGHRVAVPRCVPTPAATARWPDAEVVMLAHLLGDGCVAPRQPVHYTSGDLANIEAVEAAAAHFAITPRRVAQGNWWHVYLPAPFRLTHGKRNPIQSWLAGFGLAYKRSFEKFIPAEVFGLPDDQLALFIRHLWATDGSVQLEKRIPNVYYASTSRRLVEDLRLVLLRFGIAGRVKEVHKVGYRPGYHLAVYGAAHQLRLVEAIGVHGSRGDLAMRHVERLRVVVSNTNLDTIPVEVWPEVKQSMATAGVSARSLAAGLGTVYCGSTLYRRAPSRARLREGGGGAR